MMVWKWYSSLFDKTKKVAEVSFLMKAKAFRNFYCYVLVGFSNGRKMEFFLFL